VSRIDGNLPPHGRVRVMHPAGIVIGADGRIAASGFVASRRPISDEAFRSGRPGVRGAGHGGHGDEREPQRLPARRKREAVAQAVGSVQTGMDAMRAAIARIGAGDLRLASVFLQQGATGIAAVELAVFALARAFGAPTSGRSRWRSWWRPSRWFCRAAWPCCPRLPPTTGGRRPGCSGPIGRGGSRASRPCCRNVHPPATTPDRPAGRRPRCAPGHFGRDG
jgi:hypothetical protein